MNSEGKHETTERIDPQEKDTSKSKTQEVNALQDCSLQLHAVCALVHLHEHIDSLFKIFHANVFAKLSNIEVEEIFA